MRDLLLTTLKRLCKKENVDAVIQNENFENTFDDEYLLSSNDIVFADTIFSEFKKLPERNQKEFLYNARKDFECSKYITEKVFQSSSEQFKIF